MLTRFENFAQNNEIITKHSNNKECKYQPHFLNPRAIVGDYETLFYAIPNTQLVVFLFLYLCSFFKKSEGSVISMFIRTLVLSSSTLDDIM